MKRMILALIIVYSLMPLSTVHGYGWGFTPSQGGKAPVIGKYADLLEGHLAFYLGDQDEKHLYLTFDNGYEQGYTEKILAILKKHKVPATFFVTGHYLEREKTLVQQMVEDGHLIGNHSYDHPDFTKMTKEEIRDQLNRLDKEIANLTDQKEVVYVRPPRGTFNEQTLQWVEELGYIQLFWSLAFKDWEVDQQKGWKYAYDHIMAQAHPGAILLLHTVSEDNALALEKAILDLKKQGYHFKSLDELMIKHFMGELLF